MDKEIHLYNFKIESSMKSRLWMEEPDDFVNEYKLDLVYEPNEEEEEGESEKAGVLIAFKIRALNAFIDKESLRNVFDAHSEGLLEYYNALYDPVRKEFKRSILDQFHALGVSDLLIINTCALAPKWRGQNLGWVFVRRVMHLIGSGCELVACDPYPMCDGTADEYSVPRSWLINGNVDNEMVCTRLRKYFMGMGFQEVEDHYLVAGIETRDCPSLRQLVKRTPLLS